MMAYKMQVIPAAARPIRIMDSKNIDLKMYPTTTKHHTLERGCGVIGK
jgi:hypothetical protein